MSVLRVSRPKHPECKIGPFHHGLGVDVWLNEIHTRDGIRFARSITIAPRRYRDAHGEWKDSTSYRPVDLTTILLALEKAREYCRNTPLPGEAYGNGEWS